MQAYRCECGKNVFYGSGMFPKPCQGCWLCKTTHSQHPDNHKPVELHTPKKQFNVNTGVLDHYMCTECLTRCNEDGTPLADKKEE